MKTRIHYFLLVFSASLIMVVSGCKKDKLDIDPPVDVLTSAVIGSEGGDVSASEIGLTIPPGAFSESVEIKIYRSNKSHPYEAFANSGFFEIEGLPASFDGQLSLRIKRSTILEGPGCISLSKEMWFPTAAMNKIFHDPFPAVDSSGNLVLRMNSEDISCFVKNNEQEIRNTARLEVGASLLEERVYTNDSLWIVAPYTLFANQNSLQDLDDIRAVLVASRQQLQNKYGFSLAKRSAWPLKVVITPRGTNEEADRGEASCTNDPNSGILWLNSRFISEKQSMRTTASHEFFHILQYLYTTNAMYNWMREAFAVWYECEFSNDPVNYIPDVYNSSENKKSLFNGLHAGSLSGNPTNHGYGAFPVVRYLVQEYGPLIASLIWQECEKGKNPVSVLSAIGDPYSDLWWDDFLISYFSKDLVPDSKIELLFTSEPGSVKALNNPLKDTLFNFEREMADLSGYVYTLNPAITGWSENQYLHLRINPVSGPKVYVFKRGNGGQKLLLGSGEGEVIIKDWKDATSGGTIWLLVSNDRVDVDNFQTKTMVEIEGVIYSEDEGPTWTDCDIDFQIRFGMVQTHNLVTGIKNTAQSMIGFSTLNSGNPSMKGKFVGSTFVGSNGKESVTITLNAQRDTILVYDYYADLPYYGNTKYEIHGQRIPFYGDGQFILNAGSLTCNSIDMLDYSVTNSTYTEQLISWACQPGQLSYISFYFY